MHRVHVTAKVSRSMGCLVPVVALEHTPEKLRLRVSRIWKVGGAGGSGAEGVEGSEWGGVREGGVGGG